MKKCLTKACVGSKFVIVARIPTNQKKTPRGFILGDELLFLKTIILIIMIKHYLNVLSCLVHQGTLGTTVPPFFDLKSFHP